MVLHEAVKLAQEDISRASDQLKVARELLDRLRKTGEDTTKLEQDYRQAEQKLRRYKLAFADV